MGVSIAVVRMLAGALEQEGVALGAWLVEAGVGVERLADLRDELDEAQYERLVLGALLATSDPALGLTLGARTPVSALSLLGPLMMGSATLRDAIQVFLRYSGLLGRGAAWALAEEGEEARLSFRFGLSSALAVRFSAECAAALACKVARHFDRGLLPIAVCFAHAEPAHAPRYVREFPCPVRFHAPDNQLVLRRSALDIRNAFADTYLCESLAAIAERLVLTQSQRNTTERVRDMLRYRVDLDGFDVRHIARGLGLSESALRRRLAASGSNVTLLIEEARIHAAREALARPDCNIKELAETLGYSQSSAFHRAFKRWTGVTPRDYARSHVRAREPAWLASRGERNAPRAVAAHPR